MSTMSFMLLSKSIWYLLQECLKIKGLLEVVPSSAKFEAIPIHQYEDVLLNWLWIQLPIEQKIVLENVLSLSSACVFKRDSPLRQVPHFEPELMQQFAFIWDINEDDEGDPNSSCIFLSGEEDGKMMVDYCNHQAEADMNHNIGFDNIGVMEGGDFNRKKDNSDNTMKECEIFINYSPVNSLCHLGPSSTCNGGKNENGFFLS
ncbi:hypothetical protein ARMGADRAFT_1032671 [Armillaria gallica]|uniref:Uncharacterized protein n=1 Tax=Armillaria gallica TaxID=47427 RepID=A0A2H3D476_ARMGA|nr:hypothetical protein ARMGADRAFT_1032671 [Armillaria gallica]